MNLINKILLTTLIGAGSLGLAEKGYGKYYTNLDSLINEFSKSSENFKEIIYRDTLNPLNIKYINFNNQFFDLIIEKNKDVPQKIKEKIRFSNLFFGANFNDVKQFERDVFNEALKLGYNQERIFQAKPKEVIQLATDIVAKRMSYHNVDEDASFNKFRGDSIENVPGLFFDDLLFKIGKGNCKKYALLTTAIFDIFKKNNANLKNIYLASNAKDFGGESLDHKWNSIIFASDSLVYVSHIDPTFYDNGRDSLEAKKGFHISENELEFLAKFYYNFRDYRTAESINKNLLKQIANKEKRAKIYENLSFVAYEKKDLVLMDFVERNFYAEKLRKYKDRKKQIKENKKYLK